MACDLTASLGTCAQVPTGNPHGGRSACAGAGTSLRRTVHGRERDGLHVSGRQRHLPQRELRERRRERLADERRWLRRRRQLHSRGRHSCGIYMCAAGGVCATTCAGDFDCAAGYICQGGSCQAKG